MGRRAGLSFCPASWEAESPDDDPGEGYVVFAWMGVSIRQFPYTCTEFSHKRPQFLPGLGLVVAALFIGDKASLGYVIPNTDSPVGFKRKEARLKAENFGQCLPFAFIGHEEVVFPLDGNLGGNPKQLGKLALRKAHFKAFDHDAVTQGLHGCRNGLYGDSICRNV